MGAAGVTWSKSGSGISVASLSPPRRVSTSATARSAALSSARRLIRATGPMRPSAAVSSSPPAILSAAVAKRSSDSFIFRAVRPLSTTAVPAASPRPGFSGCMEASAGSPASLAAAAIRAQAMP